MFPKDKASAVNYNVCWLIAVPDARPKNLQATLREQAPEIRSARRVRGSGGINAHPGYRNRFPSRPCTNSALVSV